MQRMVPRDFELASAPGREHQPEVRTVHNPVAVQVGRTSAAPLRQQQAQVRPVDDAIAVDISCAINELGLREDEDLTRSKPKGEKRGLVVGDYYTPQSGPYAG